MGEGRKLVTVLFVDVVGSTALAADADTEVVRGLMDHYFAQVSQIAEAHGGTVEKFVGDAVMVVFGVPSAHDDDAERAVRTGLAIRDEVRGVTVRVGVNSGETVTASRPDRQFMVSGDVGNVAARLQQEAEPGQVVVGEFTEHLTRRAIEYTKVGPFVAKGKSSPIPAFAAVRARTTIPTRFTGIPGLRAPLIGRMRELELIVKTFARTVDDRRPHLLTVLGSPGIGKSRLVHEALAAPELASATVLRGRCLPYGRGITYWALFEALQDDLGRVETGTNAIRLLDARIAALRLEESDRLAVRSRLAVLLGLMTPNEAMPDVPSGQVGHELGWAMRRYLDTLASAGPVVLVIDDLQWAEDGLIEVLDRVLARLVTAPLLMICIARSELFERRPNWSAGKAAATTLVLDPLSTGEIMALIASLLQSEALPDTMRDRICERSAGTPLFCEEVISMLIEDRRLVRESGKWRASSADDIEVPRTIQAVLTARLDALSAHERIALQAASVIGERFRLADVSQMIGANAYEAIDLALEKGLLAQEPSTFELCFRHMLIRDVAYGTISKANRAQLHERLARHLEAESGDPRQLAEILAYHWDRALSLSLELRLESPLTDGRAREALRWALEMGERSRDRGDVVGLDASLEFARNAASSALPNAELAARLALLEADTHIARSDFVQAGASAAAAADGALRSGDAASLARIRVLEVAIASGTNIGTAIQDAAGRAIAACHAVGDAAGELEARYYSSLQLYQSGRLTEFLDAQRDLVTRARQIGDRNREVAALRWIAVIEFYRGNMPASQAAITSAAKIADRFGLRERGRSIRSHSAQMRRFAGDLDAAESEFQVLLVEREELGLSGEIMGTLGHLAYVREDRGDYPAVAQLVDRALTLSETTGDRWQRSELHGLRARAALGLGDVEMAERAMERCLEFLQADDVTATADAYESLGAIRAAQGRDDEADAAYKRSVATLASTEYIWPWSPRAVLAYAEFLAHRGRAVEARVMVDECEAWLHRRDWRQWDPQIARIRLLVAEANGPQDL